MYICNVSLLFPQGVSRCPTPKLKHGTPPEFSPRELASSLESHAGMDELSDEEKSKLASKIQKVEAEIVAMRRNTLTASGQIRFCTLRINPNRFSDT